MSKKRLVLAGIVGRYPVGGVTWCALHYIAGFQALGWEVFYLEDTGECGFDPRVNAITTDSSYALSYIHKHLGLVGLAESWAYVDFQGHYHGKSHSQVTEFCGGADLMVNLSGGYWPHAQLDGTRPFSREYERLHKIFIDTDPGFTQLAIHRAGPGWYRDFFAAHQTLFTFGLNVASESCTLAETPFRWHPTVQPIALEFWPTVPAPRGAPYTTIMSWRTDSFPGLGRPKGAHLHELIDLPRKIPCPVLLAISGGYPADLLSRHKWKVTDGVRATIDAFAYRDFIQKSRAELGFAKPTYIETRCGWISDRTLCYLASGRPAIVADTGISEVLPCGEGLLLYQDEEGVLNGIQEIESDYARHSQQARELAQEFFSCEKILGALLRNANVS